MRVNIAGIVLGSIVTMMNVAVGSATARRADTPVNCDAGYHWYSICPYLNYCAQGGVETCWQICPNQRGNTNTQALSCELFGECESVVYTC